MEPKAVVIERVLNAPVSLVWKAISNVTEMRKWYFELEEFKPEVGFSFEFTSGGAVKQYKHLCEVKESVKEKRLAYSWCYEGYPGNSLVTWELEAQGNKTLLRIIHTGLESFAANGSDFTTQSYTGGWTHFADALKTYLESQNGNGI